MKKTFIFILTNLVFYINVNSQKTYVPDDNFEQALITLGYDVGPLDDSVITSNISTIDSLDITRQNIHDLTGIEDFLMLEVLFCNVNPIDSADFSSNALLKELEINGSAPIITLTYLNVSNNLLLERLNVYGSKLSQINLLNNVALKSLSLTSTNLNSLDLSNCVNLEVLFCVGLSLPSLDLSTNTNLRLVTCRSNNLIDLDLSNNIALTYLDCSYNYLQRLNLANGTNNLITNLRTVAWPSNLPNINLCIQVDNIAYSNANWTGSNFTFKYGQVFNSTPCSLTAITGAKTYIPDNQFERFLMKEGIDLDGFNDSVLTARIDTMKSLKMNNESISSLVGIEDFIGLELLYFHDNNISSVNLSNNINLKQLSTSDNNFRKLNVTNNILLEYLNIGENQIDSIDLSNNTKLINLDMDRSNIKGLDLSNNLDLKSINCYFSIIKTLDVSNNINLETLDVRYSSIENLDLSNNINLNYLRIISDSSIRTLNLSNLDVNDISFGVYNNPKLYCVQVDDTAYAKSILPTSNLNFRLICDVCDANFTPTQTTLGQITLVDYTTGSNLKYKWYFGDGDSSNLYFPTHTYSTGGSFNVCLEIQDSSGYCFDTYCDTITIDSTGALRNAWTLKVRKSYASIKEESKFDLVKIYPNPSDGSFTLDLGKDIELEDLQITDINGRLVKTIQTQSNSLYQINFDASPGIYFLNIISENERSTLKLIKQ